MSKQTAVEWLVEELFKQIDYIQVDPKIIEQALEMEREQIIDAYDKNKMGRVDYGEQYYNETFGK
jgi:HEPN domain-containing protein